MMRRRVATFKVGVAAHDFMLSKDGPMWWWKNGLHLPDELEATYQTQDVIVRPHCTALCHKRLQPPQ